MPTVPLSELGEVVSGSTPKTGVPEFWDGDIPWITPADLSNHEGIYFHGTPKKISRAGFESCSTTMLPAGSILFSSRAPIGHCALTAYPVCTNQGFKNIVPNKRLDPVYGYFALKFLTPAIVAMGRGATFAEINKELFESIQVPYCELSEQAQIAGQLEQADRLRRTRRYALELTDTFLPAAFVTFFGDPVTNSMRWEVCALEELGALDRGRSKHRPRNAPELLGGPYPLVQTGDVANSSGYIRAYKQTYSELGLEQSKMWPKGTLCITIAANIAKTGILLFDACFPDSVVGFTPNGKTNTEYVQLWFSFVQQYLERTAPESAQKNINLEILRGLRVPLPPLKLQEEFAAVVQKVERLRAVQREALRQAEHLFASLLHRAFSGEL